VLQNGQELFTIVYNGTGFLIENGKGVSPIGSFQSRPSVKKMIADTHETISQTKYITTMPIPSGEFGIVTEFGFVRGIDTSLLAEGVPLWVSPFTAGELTTTKPTFPNYPIMMGGVTKSDVDGTIFVNVSNEPEDTIVNFWNGVFRESIDFLVSSTGGVITGSLSPANGHPDMTMMFSDGFTMLTTTPAATIILTAGTADVAQTNFVYIPKSTKVLTISTSDWPTDEHIKVAQLVLRTALITENEGAYRNQNWNDHIEDTHSFQGHLSHITERIRQNDTKWDKGAQATAAGFPANFYVSTTEGVVYQLHKQTFPASSMPTDDIHIVNHPISPNLTVNNLNSQVLDSNGVSLANSSFSFVIWGVQNKTGTASHLMCNLPTNNYSKNSPASAVADALNYSVYSIPKQFQGVGFLIARFTVVLEANGTTWSLYDTEDLRGFIPNTTAGGGGGGAGVTTWAALTDTPAVIVPQGIPRGNGAGTGLDFTTLLPSGATQIASGATAGQFWRTSGHATLPDNVVLQGV